MFPISLSFSFVYSLSLEFSFSLFSFIVSIVLCSFAFLPFHYLQFLFNLAQYSLSYLLSDQPNSFLAINYPGSSSLLNILSFLFYFLTSSIFCQYSFSNSSTAFFAFSKFSFSSQVSDLAINPFHSTKYLFFLLICCLFRIFSISHFSFSLIMTRAGYSFLCLFTCPMYFCILLTTFFIL